MMWLYISSRAKTTVLCTSQSINKPISYINLETGPISDENLNVKSLGNFYS